MTTIVRYEPRHRLVDATEEPIFARLVMEIGYRPCGVLPPEPLTGRVMAADEPFPHTARPVVWAQAAGRKRRRR